MQGLHLQYQTSNSLMSPTNPLLTVTDFSYPQKEDKTSKVLNKYLKEGLICLYSLVIYLKIQT